MGMIDGAIKEKVVNKVKEPTKYKVIMHNDDYTTMEFVVEILRGIFNKNENEANDIMFTVHRKGAAVVGIYSRDVAKTKAKMVEIKAKQEQFPLKVTVEEE